MEKQPTFADLEYMEKKRRTRRVWFSLSDEGLEDAIYDSKAFSSFMGVDFVSVQAPDATVLCNFRRLLNEIRLDVLIRFFYIPSK